MDFTPDPHAMQNILEMARPGLERACVGLVTYIKTVKLSKGRRGQGDVLTEGEPPYAWSGTLRNMVNNRWKEGDPNTQQVGVFATGDKAAPAQTAIVARVQEMGADITSSGFMTIPRTDEAVRHLKGGGTSRNFPRKLVTIPSHNRAGVLFLIEQRRGGKRNMARTETHFVLSHHAHIKRHPFISTALIEYGPAMLKEMEG